MRASKMSKLTAFHGDRRIKAKYLRRVRAHEKADEIIHGQYWENGKGCAVGCTVHSSDHGAYETELGIPEELARLEDCIFEGQTNGHAKEWPGRFLGAIRPGANLSLVWPKFAVRLLTDKDFGVAALVKDNPIVGGVIRDVAALYERTINGDRPTPEEFLKAAEAARVAGAAWAERAAEAAGDAWAERAAGAAWAERAAEAAGDAWAERAAGAEAKRLHWARCADWLVELLEGAK
jgi:hypothetical protein